MPEDVRLHFEQVRSRYVARNGKVMSMAEKSADRWTDRQTAFRLYIVDATHCIEPGLSP